MKKVEFHKGGMFVKGHCEQIEDSENYEGEWRLLNDVQSALQGLYDYENNVVLVNDELKNAIKKLEDLEHALNMIKIGLSKYHLYDVEWSSNHTGEEK